MKKIRNVLAYGIALLVLAVVGRAICNDDVLKMVNAAFSEDTIVAAVKFAESASFDVSADALIELKNKGVTEAVIQAIVQRQSGNADGAQAVQFRPITYKNVPDVEVLPPDIGPTIGQEYYTRYCFKFEDGEWETTNYWRGELVPINSKVTLVKLKGERFTLRIHGSGKTVEVKNVVKYTNRSARQIARELLADRPTMIEKYGTEMAETIKGGIPRRGMTKTQLLLTRGYPPRHETPGLESPSWRYWSSRFVNSAFVFENGVITDGPDLD